MAAGQAETVLQSKLHYGRSLVNVSQPYRLATMMLSSNPISCFPQKRTNPGTERAFGLLLFGSVR